MGWIGLEWVGVDWSGLEGNSIKPVTTSLAELVRLVKRIFVPLKFKFILKIFTVTFSFLCFIQDAIVIYSSGIKVLVEI